MKTYLKSLACGLLALTLLLACSLPATAQQYQVLSTIAAGGTYQIGPTNSLTTSNINGVVSATKWDEFLLAINFKLNGAGTTPINFTWQRSADGTSYGTTLGDGQGSFTITPAGTTQVNFLTNITMGSAGYWRLSYITNASGANEAITNLVIKAWQKPKRQG